MKRDAAMFLVVIFFVVLTENLPSIQSIKRTMSNWTVDRSIVVLSAIVVLISLFALNLRRVTVLRQCHVTLLALLALTQRIADVCIEIEIVRPLSSIACWMKSSGM